MAADQIVENSYLFASPLRARADGQQKIRLTVFVLDGKGRGVFDQPVYLKVDSFLVVSPVQPTTDTSGRAVFDISSTIAGEYPVEARVGDQWLNGKLNLIFLEN